MSATANMLATAAGHLFDAMSEKTTEALEDPVAEEKTDAKRSSHARNKADRGVVDLCRCLQNADDKTGDEERTDDWAADGAEKHEALVQQREWHRTVHLFTP